MRPFEKELLPERKGALGDMLCEMTEQVLQSGSQFGTGVLRRHLVAFATEIGSHNFETICRWKQVVGCTNRSLTGPMNNWGSGWLALASGGW